MSLRWFSSFFCLLFRLALPGFCCKAYLPFLCFLYRTRFKKAIISCSFPFLRVILSESSREVKAGMQVCNPFAWLGHFAKSREGGRQREIGVARAACSGPRFRVLVCCSNLGKVERSMCSYFTEGLKSIIHLVATQFTSRPYPLRGFLINGAVIAGPLSCHGGRFAQRERGESLEQSASSE